MAKKVFDLPGGLGAPISAAVRAGDFIFVSGLGVYEDSKTGKKIKGIKAQTKLSLERMREVLAMAGASLDDVVKVTAYLFNVNDFPKMNEVFITFFPNKPPARKTIFMPFTHEGPDLLVEFDCIAYRPQ
jgi:2-iminobutanoate/2-iminopropanoate deaminase